MTSIIITLIVAVAIATEIRFNKKIKKLKDMMLMQFHVQGGGESSDVPPLIAPTVYAGIDQTIQLPINQVSLTATATQGSGAIASYSWTKVSGGSATIISSGSSSTQIMALSRGSYVFNVKVTDTNGLTANDSVSINVLKAVAPNPLVSKPKTIPSSIQLPATSIALNGSDSEGNILTYLWEQVGSTPKSVSIGNVSSMNTTVSNMTEKGTYTFKLTVSNSLTSQSDSSIVTTKVLAEQVAFKFTPTSITLPYEWSEEIINDAIQADSSLSWTLSSNESWLTFLPIGAQTGSNSYNIKVIASENGDRENNRVGLITATSVSGTITLAVIQEFLPYNTIEIMLGGGSGIDESGACGKFSSNPSKYYIDKGVDFETATKLYSDQLGSGNALEGYYSDGSIVRYWHGEVFGNTTNCI